MPVPATINDLSTTAGSNYPAGTESPTVIDDYFRSHASFIAQLRDGKVATSGNETIAGIKTFSSTIVGNISGSAGSATTATTATTATSCTNVAGGANGSVPYQTGSGATSFIAAGTSGYLLQTNGAGAPTWVNPASLSVSSATSATTATTANNVSGTVAIANGGTGQTTAANAFAALKQDATTAATGVVELATNAEVQAGSDTVRAVTPAAFASASFGTSSQSWQNVTGARAIGGTYTNNTGRAIQVAVTANIGNGGGSLPYLQAVAGGVQVDLVILGDRNGSDYEGIYGAVTFTVPNGSSYYVAGINGSPSLVTWSELT